VFENRVQRRIFERKRDEVTGEWMKLHCEALWPVFLTNFYAGNQIKKNEMGGACSAYGGQVCIRGFGGKT